MLSSITDRLFGHRGPCIKDLFVYPIKSCRGIRISSAVITPRGIQYDRLFMIVTSDGTFISQRKYPRMSLIVPQIFEQPGWMVVTAPGMRELRVPLASPLSPQTMAVRLWGAVCKADLIRSAGEWFSEFLQVDGLQLVRMCNDFALPSDPDYAPDGQTAFMDECAFMLTSEASLASLNEKLEVPVGMDRFRPNIVITNSAAFEEDTWKTIAVHTTENKDLMINLVKPRARCPIPNVNPATGISHFAPTVALRTFRTGEALGMANPSWKRNVFFGQNCDHGGQSGVTIEVGTSIGVLT